jgi:hypothetical protein
MQMGVSPSHYNLKDIVQAIEIDTAALSPGAFTPEGTKLLPFWSVGHF